MERPTLAQITEKLEKFTEEFKSADGDGGWPDVTQKETEQFYRLIEAIARRKWQTDSSNDLPVDIHIVDRTRFEPWHWFSVPYSHKAQTREDWDRLIDYALTNVRMAAETVERVTKSRRFLNRKEAQVDQVKLLKRAVEALNTHKDAIDCGGADNGCDQCRVREEILEQLEE